MFVCEELGPGDCGLILRNGDAEGWLESDASEGLEKVNVRRSSDSLP